MNCYKSHEQCLSDTTLSFTRRFLPILFAACSFFALPQAFCSDTQDNDDSNNALINKYIKARGENIIAFNSNNIKQFWVDSSVAALNDYIIISFHDSLESTPQKVQFTNVDNTMDCNIEIITANHDVSFSVYNLSMEQLSSSTKGNSFLDFDCLTASVHLEDTDNFSFYIKFNSLHPKTVETVRIKAIIFSFSKNKVRDALTAPSSVERIIPPIPSMDQKNICENGDFEKELSNQQLDSFKKKLADIGNTTYLTSDFKFPQNFSLGLSKNNSSSPPLFYLSSDNPISGKYSFLVDTTHTDNDGQFAYHGIKKGNYVYWGVVKGLSDETSELTIRPYYVDAQSNKYVYLRSTKIKIDPNAIYYFRGAVRFSEIKAPTFSLHFQGTGKFLFDNLNIVPQ